MSALSTRRDPAGTPSVLFAPECAGADALSDLAPGFFGDLNLDQIVASITQGKTDYNLQPFFYSPLTSVAAVEYRQEVMRDVQNPAFKASITKFARTMRRSREQRQREKQAYYPKQQEAWFLEVVCLYCQAVGVLAEEFAAAELSARGLVGFGNYLRAYVDSESFRLLCQETNELKNALSSIEYVIDIRDGSFTVRRYESEPDYSTEIEAVFEKFKRGAVKNYLVEFTDTKEMNHIEAKILDFVAELYPEVFARLSNYRRDKSDSFLDQGIIIFDREIQFYVAYLDYLAPLVELGLNVCYPTVTKPDKEIFALATADLALANKLANHSVLPVENDFYLSGEERIFVVTGPNQGGKTTFARMLGQLHYLASLGCPVVGKKARLFLCDRIFTHFERQEDINDQQSKLEHDLVRIRQVLLHATSDSLIIMNEMFSSTTLADAIWLGRRILDHLVELGGLGICVTFVDEWAAERPGVVSLVSTTETIDTEFKPTFRIVRGPSNGLALAMAIASNYGLTYDRLTQRIAS
jgi:DNA mismatch repair protein MutS